MPELSEIGKQEKAFNMTLLDVAGAKEALKLLKKRFLLNHYLDLIKHV